MPEKKALIRPEEVDTTDPMKMKTDYGYHDAEKTQPLTAEEYKARRDAMFNPPPEPDPDPEGIF
jgi:hypothetical protein